jgi:hypothetical protein
MIFKVQHASEAAAGCQRQSPLVRSEPSETGERGKPPDADVLEGANGRYFKSDDIIPSITNIYTKFHLPAYCSECSQ